MKTAHNISVWLLGLLTLGLPAGLLAQNGTPGKPVIDTIRNKQVTVSWQTAETIYGFTDDFESHTDFTINSPGSLGWQYADMDHDQEYLIGATSFPNVGNAAAFRIWNPSQTIPAYTSPRGLPHSGNKCLISFATHNDYRNDWLISPELTRYNFTDSIRLSFWARTFNSSYGGNERINLGYSTTDAKPSSFTFINGNTPVEIPESNLAHPGMYYFEFTFPATAKYIAVNCVTVSGQALLIDDVAIGTNKVMPNKGAHNYLQGYNLYRNSEKVNATLINASTFIDNVPDYGAVSYQVEAVFEDGSKTRSETLDAEIPDIRILPFVERFERYDLTYNFWELNPADGNYWSADYREGGLVIPAATFKPRPALTNYHDYCLESKNLTAKGLNGVILAYDISCNNYTGAGGGTTEHMKAEVWDGTQWHTVQTHTNKESTYEYTRFYIDISQYVAGKENFKVRFNAGGEYAMSINSWYICYVKVYEKAKATISGTATCGGTAVANAAITWTSQDEDVYKTLSGADGSYRIENVDAGTYTVTAKRPDYNPYKAEKTAVEKGSKTYDIAMTQPAFAALPTEVPYTLEAEAQTEGKITLTNNGNGPARVKLNVDYGQPATGKVPALKPIKTFRPRDVLQSALCFDGTYFYTARSDESGDGVIEKYDREGNYIESFQPSIHVRRYFDIAFDGAYFYTANNDNIIRRMDFETHEILEEIVTPVENINHIAYDEARDAFYVGALNSIALVGKDGRIIEEEVAWPSDELMFAGSAYDPYFKEGPTMWIMDQSKSNNDANSPTFAVLRRFDLTTKTVKNDYVFDCSTLPDFVYGNGTIGKVWGESLFGTTRYLDGHFVIMGMILSDPGLAYILDMYETDSWLKPSVYSLDVAAGETKEIPYAINATEFSDGTMREADLQLVFEPKISAFTQKIKLQVSGKADLARPTVLTATAQDDRAAVLTWQAPDGATAPQSYKIYRNGEAAGTAPAGTLTYTDNNLKFGLYTYEVTAVYAGGESKKSPAAEVEIFVGIPCYRPQHLTARNVRNEEISLVWQDPTMVGNEPVDLKWGSGLMNDFINMVENATFIGAAAWTSSELADYRNMKFESVTFVPMTIDGKYTIKIWEDNTLIHEQAAGSIKAGLPNTIALNKALTINDRHSLRVGIEAAKGAALGIDGGKAVEGKGNWVYADKFGSWMTLTAMGGSDANFLITLNLQPKAQPETNTAKAYNVYRNGIKINAEPVNGTTYTDRPGAGLYTYTVTAIHENCESYASTPASVRIIELTEHAAPENLSARVIMNREVRLDWMLPFTHTSLNAAKSGNGYEPFSYVKNFDLSETGEAAVVTDGEYIYTSFFNKNGVFNRYDLQGRFIETFTIAGVPPMLDLTWDGRYFYGGNNTAELYCLDFETRTLVKKMTVTAPVRHCAYIPDLDGGKGGFEIGDWTTSFFVTMNGTYLNKGYNPTGAFGSAYYDGKLYYFQQRQYALCEIVEVDFATLTPTGNRADLNRYSQYRVDDNARAGGLATFTSMNGSMMLLANIQNGGAPNKLVWVEATPNTFVSGFNLYRNGAKVNGGTPLSSREYTDTLSQAGTYAYTVSAIYVDGVEGEKSTPVTVTIVEPTHCETPVNVTAVVKDRDVRLQWTSVIDQLTGKDDMESYANLTTGNIGEYRTVDADNQPTYMPEGWNFTGAGKPAAFRVLDQRLLNPAQNNLAFSGNKFLAAFAAAESELVAVNYSHDWLIMPAAEINGQAQWISFMARGLDINSQEAFRVAYSRTGNDTADFIRVAQKADYVNCLWTRFTYDLPADVTYVAIEYLSGNGKALFIDDITVATGACVFRADENLDAGEEFVEKVAGYSIYRDGTLLNAEPIHANAYFDGNLPNGSYNYTLKALYNTSCESEASSPVKVSVNYKAPQGAPRNLAGTVKRDTVSLTWEAPAYAEDKMLSYAGSEVKSALGFADEAVYYAAQHWEASELLGVFGYRIYAVTAVFAEKPVKLDLVIFQDNELIYEQDVTANCQAMKLSTFLLNEPFEVDYAKSLTIGFRIQAQAESYSIAVDKGPVAANKGDLYSDDGINWVSADYYHGTKGNWFFAALMDLPEPAAGNQNGLLGYLVYRNEEPARKELIQTLNFTESGLPRGIHTYAVAAVYNNGEQRSESITLRVNVTANEDLDENRLRVFPNPATDHFTVYGAFDYVEVLDLQGKPQLRHEAAQGADVRVAGLPAGVYMVRLYTANGTAVRKLVIRK